MHVCPWYFLLLILSESAAYVYKQCYQPLCGGLGDFVLLNKVTLSKLMMDYLFSFLGISNEDFTRFHAGQGGGKLILLALNTSATAKHNTKT